MKRLNIVSFLVDKMPQVMLVAGDSRAEIAKRLELETGGQVILANVEQVSMKPGTSLAIKNDGGVYVTEGGK